MKVRNHVNSQKTKKLQTLSVEHRAVALQQRKQGRKSTWKKVTKSLHPNHEPVAVLSFHPDPPKKQYL